VAVNLFQHLEPREISEMVIKYVVSDK
jgi:hypothetical protein